MKIIAIDFDGCLCENEWPKIGAPHWAVINAALAEQRNGAALIFWTCRCGDLLAEALAWCKKHGLEFDAVNENLPERVSQYDIESRKINADEYWDDRAVHMPGTPNNPLTLEELREMDGEPVWGVFSEGKDRYMIIQWHNSEFFKTFECGFLLVEEYGKSWIAYRRKPEKALFQDGE